MSLTDRHHDRARATAVGVAAAAQCLIPTLGPLLLGTHEDVEDLDTVITPPNYAFAVWGPIFAGTIAHAVQQAGPAGRRSPGNRSTGWPLAAAYAVNAGWSVAAQSGNVALTPALLPASTAFTALAHRRLQQHESRGADRLAPLSTGLLLGWTSLASAVNVLAVARLRGSAADSRAGVATATAGAVGVCAVLTATVRRSREGYLPLAATAVWGLATTALDRRRPVVVRLVTAAGGLAIAGTALAQRSRPIGPVGHDDGAKTPSHPG